MLKRPLIISLLIAGTLALGSAVFMLSTTRNVDEKPFMIYFVIVAFPFVWFLIWVFLTAIAWWQGLFEVETQDEGAIKTARDVGPNGTGNAT